MRNKNLLHRAFILKKIAIEFLSYLIRTVHLKLGIQPIIKGRFLDYHSNLVLAVWRETLFGGEIH